MKRQPGRLTNAKLWSGSGIVMLTAMVAVLSAAPVASACPVFADGSLAIRIEATANGQTAVFEQVFAAGAAAESQYVWSLPNELSLQDQAGHVLATLKDLQLNYELDPGVNLAFEVQAAAWDTTFNIQSSIITFPSTQNPKGYALAAVTVMDAAGGGATLEGMFAGGMAYQARYNSNSIFASLIGPMAADPDDSASVTERIPDSGRLSISDNVTSIESQFHFVLSANDLASGSSRFDVMPVPEPFTVGVLAVGGLTLLRRRRRVL